MTVNGAHGVHGTYVQGPVVVECRDEVGEFYNMRGTEAGPVKVMHRKCKDAHYDRIPKRGLMTHNSTLHQYPHMIQTMVLMVTWDLPHASLGKFV